MAYPCRLFEPYIVQLMGKLLERFGDVSASVRKATNNVARGIMGNLSSQGAPRLRTQALGGWLVQGRFTVCTAAVCMLGYSGRRLIANPLVVPCACHRLLKLNLLILCNPGSVSPNSDGQPYNAACYCPS